MDLPTLLQKLGLSVNRLSLLLDISPTSLNHYRTGRRTPPSHFAELLGQLERAAEVASGKEIDLALVACRTLQERGRALEGLVAKAASATGGGSSTGGGL